MTAGDALLILAPALAVVYAVGVLHGWCLAAKGSPAHPPVRPASRTGDEARARMGGQTRKQSEAQC